MLKTSLNRTAYLQTSGIISAIGKDLQYFFIPHNFMA